MARTSASRIQVFHLEQLAILVGIIKQHVRNHTTEIFKLVQDLWDNVLLQLPLMSLVEALGKALDAEFACSGRIRGPLHGGPVSFKDVCQSFLALPPPPWPDQC